MLAKIKVQLLKNVVFFKKIAKGLKNIYFKHVRETIVRFKFSLQYNEAHMQCFYFGRCTDTSLNRQRRQQALGIRGHPLGTQNCTE